MQLGRLPPGFLPGPREFIAGKMRETVLIPYGLDVDHGAGEVLAEERRQVVARVAAKYRAYRKANPDAVSNWPKYAVDWFEAVEREDRTGSRSSRH